jgi:hypothetical protein
MQAHGDDSARISRAITRAASVGQDGRTLRRIPGSLAGVRSRGAPVTRSIEL